MALFSITLVLRAQPNPATPPDTDSQAKIIAALTSRALQYEGHLPDFVCTKVTTRSTDSTGSGDHLKQRDVLEERVSFSEGRAVYTLLKISGNPTKNHAKRPAGLIEDNLLASAIAPTWIFGPRAPVTFEWSRWDAIEGKPAHVIAFRVAPSITNHPDGKTPYLVGFHGLAWVRAADNTLLRLESHTDGPPGYPFRDSGSIIDYGSVDLSGSQFLLPVKGVSFVLIGKTLQRNTIEFTVYGKFQSDTVIKFSDSGKM
jgi:hypothetical protein